MDLYIAEELEHLAFMQEITDLRTRIYGTLLTREATVENTQSPWNDIATYGTEPVFASLVHDRMLAEAGLA